MRERYLTPRRAADQDFGVGYGDPPSCDSDRTRIVEVTARRRDRALVVTMERFEDDPPLEARYENRLHLIDGEWRLNTRWLNDLDGEPQIDGLL